MYVAIGHIYNVTITVIIVVILWTSTVFSRTHATIHVSFIISDRECAHGDGVGEGEGIEDMEYTLSLKNNIMD